MSTIKTSLTTTLILLSNLNADALTRWGHTNTNPSHLVNIFHYQCESVFKLQSDIYERLIHDKNIPSEFKGAIVNQNIQQLIWNLKQKNFKELETTIKQEILQNLSTQSVKKKILISNSISEVFLVKLSSGLTAIFKPQPSDWLVKSKAAGFASNYKAEVLAYKISDYLNLNIVPLTTERQIDTQYGSIQLFIPGEQASNENAPDISFRNLAKIKLLDYLIGNSDRRSDNLILPDEQTVVAIDHGQSFMQLKDPRSMSSPKLSDLNNYMPYLENEFKQLLGLTNSNIQYMFDLVKNELNELAANEFILRLNKVRLLTVPPPPEK